MQKLDILIYNSRPDRHLRPPTPASLAIPVLVKSCSRFTQPEFTNSGMHQIFSAINARSHNSRREGLLHKNAESEVPRRLGSHCGTNPSLRSTSGSALAHLY